MEFPECIGSKKDDPHGRFATNFGPLTKKIDKDYYHHSIPVMFYLLEKLNGKRVFSVADMATCFRQFQIHEDSRDILSMTGPDGKHWRYANMPFGVAFAAEVCKSTMESIVGNDLLWLWVMIYIDDFLIATETYRAHLFVLRELFARLVEKRARLKLTKNEFLKHEVMYIGHLVNGNGHAPNPERLRAFAAIPDPKSKEDVRKFLNTTGWHMRNYAPGYAQAAVKLIPLTSKDMSVKFVFGPEHKEAWNEIKTMAAKKLFNTHLKPGKVLFVVTDASDKDSICCMLFQCDAKALVSGQQPEPEECELVTCFSRALTVTEKRYHVIEKEMLALVFATVKLRHFVLGVPNVPFFTDHKPLLGVMKKLHVENARLEAMKVKVAEFDVDLRHVKGIRCYADYWTRLGAEFNSPNSPTGTDDDCKFPSSTADDSKLAAALVPRKSVNDSKLVQPAALERPVAVVVPWNYADGDLQAVSSKQIRSVALGREVKVGQRWRMLVPAVMQRSVITEAHGTEHCGVNKLREKLRSYYWPRMDISLQEYVDGCAC